MVIKPKFLRCKINQAESVSLWKRKEYTFDYSIHNLFGMIASSEDNKVWRELGALCGLETYSFKEFVQIEDTNGKAFTVYTDLDQLERHMIELSPVDKKKLVNS